MPSSASLFFDKIFNWDGVGTASSDYTDVTLEAQSPAGTAFTIFNTAAHYLYLGHDEKFDMAMFDVDTAGGLGVLTWQYYNGSAWTTFTPASARYRLDPDGNEGEQYSFAADGVEEFPSNILSDWSTVAINSQTKYWVRVTAASVATAPTIKRIRMRPINAYCTTADVFDLMQLNNVLDATNFGTGTVPTKTTVENYIMAAQSQVDYKTRKSWGPMYVADEYHEFNINGFKSRYTNIHKILGLQIWDGADWETKTQGRDGDYFFAPDTGMIYYSRFFILPARFASYNAPVWKWGGGEFNVPVRISYIAGKDFHTDQREAGIVFDATRKLAAVDIVRSADFGNIVVSGADRVMMAQRADSWSIEADDMLSSLRAFEVF